MTSADTRARVLLVEDDDTTAAILMAAIVDGSALRDAQASFNAKRVATLADAMEALARDTYAAVLLDLSLPDSSGIETLHAVLASAPQVAVIVLTSLDDSDLALRAVRLGAQDYLYKGRVDSSLIVRSLLYSITRTRAEAQLRQAQQVEGLGRLAGGIAHDFNNLLAIIIGNAEAAQDPRSAAHEITEALGEIHHAALRAATLTARLLSLGRPQQYQPCVFDVGDIVHGLEDTLRGLVDADTIFVVQREEGDLTVRADPAQLEQVILNLVVNARDAVRPGGRITIEVGAVTVRDDEDWQPRPRPGPYVGLTVRDDGHGIRPEVQSHLFDPFMEFSGPGKDGLGLSIIAGIVQQGEGAIRYVREAGGGTMFTIALPAIGVPTAKAGELVSVARQIAGGETILLVDDESSVRSLVRRILERDGYRVIDVASGDEALTHFQEHGVSVDLVVTDVVMPGLRGPEMARELERRRPGIPVLFTSGYHDDDLVLRGIYPEHVAFLQKPWTHRELLDAVRERLQFTPRPQVISA